MCISGPAADLSQVSASATRKQLPPQPLSSIAWRQYFLRNKANLRPIPWELGAQVTDTELAAICSSVQEFQLGESSDGHRFIERATHYARLTGDWQYVEALRLFIAEEQRHGRELGRFLQLAGAPLLQHTWIDQVFRYLRHLAGLETMIVVLVTAEIIAQVYYDALRAATSSTALRILCDQILDDEEEHVQFQCGRLAILRRDRSPVYVAIMHSMHQLLLGCTCLLLWKKHGRTFRAGGYSLFSFIRSAFQYMRIAHTIANPASYANEQLGNAPVSQETPNLPATS